MKPLRVRKPFKNDPEFDAMLALPKRNPSSLGLKSISTLPLKKSNPQPRSSSNSSHLRADGVVRIHARGFGFLFADDGQSYFIPTALAQYLIQGDYVKVSLKPGARKGAAPEVHQIYKVRRDGATLMCRVTASSTGELWLEHESSCAIPLELSEGVETLKEGDVLGVDVPNYDGGLSRRPLSVKLRVNLGPRPQEACLEFDREYARTLHRFDEAWVDGVLDLEFEQMVSIGASVSSSDYEDFTSIPFITIDDSASDVLDDALYAKALEAGGWEVLIAIADVSAYVVEGGELDRLAKKRATSLYFPDKVFPMIPEYISSDICSFQQGEVKSAVVFKVRLDKEGNELASEVFRAKIKSHARLEYSQVTDYLERGVKLENVSHEGVLSLNNLYQIYHQLFQARKSKGVLDFEESEPVFIHGRDGQWELADEKRGESHRLVEMLMILANEVAARLIKERYGMAILRTQPKPSETAWNTLVEWARTQGALLPHSPNLKSISQMLEAFDQRQYAEASSKVLTVMSPANYRLVKEGSDGSHFSLDSDAYTHFTSPIRRYVDLINHRLLLAPSSFELSASLIEELEQVASHCSERGRAAKMAERYVLEAARIKGLMSYQEKEPLQVARVLRQTPRGLRVFISRWQVNGWILGSNLIKRGFNWTGRQWEISSNAVSDGQDFSVTIEGLKESLPGHLDLEMKLA